jgi:hypothetical protein
MRWMIKRNKKINDDNNLNPDGVMESRWENRFKIIVSFFCSWHHTIYINYVICSGLIIEERNS